MRHVCCLCILAIICAGANFARAQTGAVDDALSRGIQAYFQGQASAAEQMLTSLIDGGLNDPQAFYFRGLAHWRQGREDAARADFTQGAKLEAATGMVYRRASRSLERVQGPARLALQQIRQAERVATTTEREKQRLSSFDMKNSGETVAAPAPTANTTAGTTSAPDPFAPKPATSAPDPFAPKAAMPATAATPPAAAPPADPFGNKPAAPAPAATATTPPASPSATTPAASPAAGPIVLPESPDQLYAALARHAANGHPEAAWQALPPKYQADVTSVIHEFGAKMDKELWDKSFSVVGKLAKVLKDKRDFILGHPLVALSLPQLQINGKAATVDDVKKGWDPSVDFLQAILASEISTVDGVAKLDPPAYLAGSFAKAMTKFYDAMAVAEGKTKDQLVDEQLAKTKVTIAKTDGDTMDVLVEVEGQEPKTIVFKKVETRWLPADLVDKWDENIAQAKATIAMMDFAGPQKAQVLGVFGLVEPTIDQLLAAPDQDSFNTAIGGVIGLIQGMMGGGAPPGM